MSAIVQNHDYDTNASRRSFLQYLGAHVAGCAGVSLLSGCKREEGGGEPDVVKLSFYGTGTLDILEDGWQRAKSAALVDVRFVDNGNNTGPVIAQMIAGTAVNDHDIGGLQGGAERELFESATILPWDLSKIPNWGEVWEMAKNIPYTRSSTGDQLGLPIALNADSMIYLPDELRKVTGFESGTLTSYSAIFDERLKGRVAMEDAWINSVIFTAIFLKEHPERGIPIDDPGDLAEIELELVMSFLIDLKKGGQFYKFWQGWEQGVQLLENTEVIAMTGWEPIVYELRKRNVNAVYAEPTEGYEGWSNDLLLHSGTRDTERYDAAHRFANWLYEGFYGCTLANLRGYAVPSEKARRFAADAPSFNEADVDKLFTHVKTKFDRGGGAIYWQNVRPRNYRLYEDWWTRLRQA